MRDLLVSFATVFIAEIGDKSQLIVVAMSVVLSRRRVLAGVAISAAISQTLSVALGTVAGDALSQRAALIVAGLAFMGFAIWAALERSSPDATGPVRTSSGIAMVASAVFLAELGDKTMFATAALAVTANPVSTWLGSFLALVAAAALALLVGSRLLARIPRRHLRPFTAALFALVGVVMLANGLWV